MNTNANEALAGPRTPPGRGRERGGAPRSGRFAGRLLGGLALLLLAGAGLARANGPVADGILRVGTIEHFALDEGSGLAASRRYPGVVWSHNDGGYQFLFALSPTGQYLGAFQVVGANLIDWEAVAADDLGNLYLADIGSNGLARTHVAVHRVREPNPERRSGNAEVTRTWYLRFPVPRVDCEGFFVLDGYGYLVTKPRDLENQVTLYRYPLASTANSTLLELVGRFPVTASVTDATVSPDGLRLGILTSQGAYVYYINRDPAVITSPSVQREFTPFINDFMEGATFVDDGLLVSAETRELWLFTNGTFQCRAPAAFVTPLGDRSALLGSAVELDPGAVGCPVPAFQWTFQGQAIPGATNATLTLPAVGVESAGRYEVTASNRFGVAISGATLTIRSKPDVRITEVLSGAALSPGVPTADWWELTNFEQRPVDLAGWRFNDSVGGLSDPYTFPGGLIVAPGESIVLVEALTAAEFANWWGAANLPPGLQIHTYSGSGLSFRLGGDTLSLWDATSTDAADTVARADFGVANLGVTFNYDPVTGVFGGLSVLGVNGVFQAAAAPDIGSPGRIAAPPAALRLAASGGAAANEIRIEFPAEAGRTYVLEASTDVSGEGWQPTGDVHVAVQDGVAQFQKTQLATPRFYRIRVEAGPR